MNSFYNFTFLNGFSLRGLLTNIYFLVVLDENFSEKYLK